MRKRFEQNAEPIKDVSSVVDYTLLSQTATMKDLQRLCNVAYKHRYYAVCVNPCNVTFVKNYISREMPEALKIVSVVGFPLGQNTLAVKIAETKRALADGADEIDAVLNLGNIKNGDWGSVKTEISRIVRTCRRKVVKIIIEATELDRDEIAKVCKLCVKAKVDFVKTSTGFAKGGATPELVELISQAVGGRCGVKASGGIASKDEAFNMLRAGASRIGTSREI